jgi:hypothetical protein
MAGNTAIWRRDTRGPEEPFHPVIPGKCEHDFEAPHLDTLYTNNPAGFAQGDCGSPGIVITKAKPYDPQLSMFDPPTEDNDE